MKNFVQQKSENATTLGEDICLFDKGLVCRIYKELLEAIRKERQSASKNGHKA